MRVVKGVVAAGHRGQSFGRRRAGALGMAGLYGDPMGQAPAVEGEGLVSPAAVGEHQLVRELTGR